MIRDPADWDNGFSAFLAEATKSSTPPWNTPYESRRSYSLEERVKRQLSAERGWDGTPIEGIWKCLRTIAHPSRDFKFSTKEFSDFLRLHGVCSSILHREFCSLILEGQHSARGIIDGVVLCKALQIGFEQEVTRGGIIGHCYRSLPLQLHVGDGFVTLDTVDNSLKSIEPAQGNATQLVRHEQLSAVKQLMEDRGLTEVDLFLFETIFLSPECGMLSKYFLKQIFEACFKFFKPPYGMYPLVPLRWINSIEPVSFDWRTPADADAVLLLHAEFNRKDANERTTKKRSKKSRKPAR